MCVGGGGGRGVVRVAGCGGQKAVKNDMTLISAISLI